MEKTYTVYMHTNKINNKVYVGITSQKVNGRWRLDGGGYLRKNKDGSYAQPKFARAILKYGWDNFEHIIWAEGLTHDDACHIERLLIGIWNSRDCGYNMTTGGEGVCGVKHYGEDNPFYGKRHSEESRLKMSKARKGKFVLENNHFYGKHHTEETKRLIQEANGKPVCQFDMDLNFIQEYPSAKFAEKCTGIWHSMISGCCNRQECYKTAGGFIWIYKDEVDCINKEEYMQWIHHDKLPKPVYQFSLKMEFIKEYPSIGEASRQTGIPNANISVALSGKVLSSGGYIWILKEDFEKMKRGEIPFRQPYKKSFYQEVIQYTLDGEFIQEFESKAAAGKAIGVSGQAIGYACNSQTHRCKNYLFKLKGE